MMMLSTAFASHDIEFREPFLLPGFCGCTPAGAWRAMIGTFRSSRAGSVAHSYLQPLGDQLKAEFVDGDACRLCHGDNVFHIVRSRVVKAGFGVVDACIGFVQKSCQVSSLAQQLSQHHFHCQKSPGKLAAIVYRRIIHGGHKPLLSLRNTAFSCCGPP